MNGYRIAGTLFDPKKGEEHFLEAVRPTKEFGRWIYCKYCYKNVKPMLSGVFQIICSECGYGLTPYFLSKQELKQWLKKCEL